MGNSGAKDGTDGEPLSSAADYSVLKDLGASLNGFRESDILCDVALVVDEKVFRAHRLLLAASSPYFLAMFTGNFTEAGERMVRLRGVVSDKMPEILHFIYTGQLEITENSVKDVLADAHHLQILALTKRCFQFLEEKLAVHNCIITYGFADTYSNSELKAKAEDFIIKNFPAVSETEEFLELPADNLIRLIAQDELTVDTEDVVCKAVFKWLHSDDQTRQPYFADVLRNVRLTFVSTDLLRELDEKEDIIKMSTECTSIVKKALFRKLSTKQEEKPRAQYANRDAQ